MYPLFCNEENRNEENKGGRKKAHTIMRKESINHREENIGNVVFMPGQSGGMSRNIRLEARSSQALLLCQFGVVKWKGT